MKRFASIALILLMIGWSSSAYAICFEPTPPSRYSKPTPPTVPFCVNEFARTHTCEAWVINRYNDDVERYYDQVDDYVRDLRQYVDDAVAYANCEIRSLE